MPKGVPPILRCHSVVHLTIKTHMIEWRVLKKREDPEDQVSKGLKMGRIGCRSVESSRSNLKSQPVSSEPCHFWGENNALRCITFFFSNEFVGREPSWLKDTRVEGPQEDDTYSLELTRHFSRPVLFLVRPSIDHTVLP